MADNIIKILKAELALPAYTSMTDREAMDTLNAPTAKQIRTLTSAELLAWSAIDDRYGRVLEAMAVKATRSIASAAMEMIRRDNTELDLNDAGHQSLVVALVAAGILTPAETDELTAMATVAISRGDELGIGMVKLGHIQMARL